MGLLQHRARQEPAAFEPFVIFHSCLFFGDPEGEQRSRAEFAAALRRSVHRRRAVGAAGGGHIGRQHDFGGTAGAGQSQHFGAFGFAVEPGQLRAEVVAVELSAVLCQFARLESLAATGAGELAVCRVERERMAAIRTVDRRRSVFRRTHTVSLSVVFSNFVNIIPVLLIDKRLFAVIITFLVIWCGLTGGKYDGEA